MAHNVGPNQFSGTDTATTPKGKFKAKTESKTLVAANPARVELYVCNNGENAVFLALGPTAVNGEGIRLNKEGGTVVIPGYSGEVTVISSTGEVEVCYAEA